MKKTRFFSRFFAAFLAVATAIVPLSTPGVAADPAPKYTVKIISPDVPNDGSTYTYKFYQIISGEVEQNEDTSDTLHKFVISNPQWGAALGGANFGVDENVRLVQEDNSNPDAAINELNITKAEALITAISETDANDSTTSGSDVNVVARGQASAALGKYFSDLVFNYQSGNISSSNGFKNKFAHNITSGSPRTASGFVEALNKVNDSQTLKAFADLIFNGISAGSYNWNTSGNKADLPEIKFLDSNNYNSKSVSIDGNELSVELGEPGYYLVACVKGDKLTNDEYNKPKPVSAMLLLVGEGENQIVGKNTTAVATVDFKMYHETVSLTAIDELNNDYNATYGTKKLEWHDEYQNEDLWSDRASFGNLRRTITTTDGATTVLTGEGDFDEFVLCRLDITLPKNFESYKEVGYFLAVAGNWGANNNGSLKRVTNCRPLIVTYPEGGKPDEIGYLGNSSADTLTNKIGYKSGVMYVDGYGLNPLYNIDRGNLFGVNDGKTAEEYFYLGNLFNSDVYDSGYEDAFKSGDHIYIYFPAYYNASQTTISGGNNMTIGASAWVIYSNNPHTTAVMKNELITDPSASVSGNVYKCGEHIASNDVGISKVSSINVNSYSLKWSVTGKNNNGEQVFDRFSSNYPVYALYKKGADNIKRYALMYRGRNTATGTSYDAQVVGWYTTDELKKYSTDFFADDKINTENISISSDYNITFILNEAAIRDKEFYRNIHGLAPGEYYIEELTIGEDTNANIKNHHYQKATKPFKLTIDQKYNPDYAPFNKDTKNQLIDELSVTFAQEDPADRTIDSEVVTPAPAADGDKHSATKKLNITNEGDTLTVDPATADGLVEVKITHNSLHLIWLPETGGIGTTIFFIVGGIIVVAATVLIVTRFRVKRERL